MTTGKLSGIVVVVAEIGGTDWRMMQRKDVKPDTLYFDCKTEQYFWTPNGNGVIWLTPQEADYQFDADVDAVIVSELLDF